MFFYVVAEPASPVSVQSLAITGSVTNPAASLWLSAKPSGQAENMTTNELCEWLKAIHVCDEYIKLFEENDINGGTLATLNDEDLEDMGISKRFIRKNIMVRFRQIK